MADLRRPSLRLGVGLAIVVMGLVEILTLVQTVRSHARERARVVRSAGDTLAAARPALEAALRPGGRQAWQLVAEEALRATHADEAEIFDGAGQRLLAHPAVAPVVHWPSDMEGLRLRSGEVVTVGPVAGDAARVLSYVSFVSGGEQVVLRVSTAVPDLVEEMREHRQLLIGHALALLVVVTAGAMALAPGHAGAAGTAPSRALDAYEAAMGRLREEGQAATRRHDAERRRLEELFKDREAMARAGELTAGIVHEVRNGLGTVVGYARLIEQAPSVADAREAGAAIRSECETLEIVFRRFMEFVKEETLNVEPFDLGRMLSRVVARESRGGAGGEVTLARGEAGTVAGDEALLERAFENLVRNAREAAGPAGHVWVEAARDAAKAVVTVTDDGPGLTPEARNKLRPFFTTKAGGLGLGLPLAFKIVRLHDGELTFSDRSPRGLRVAVRLPLEGPAR